MEEKALIALAAALTMAVGVFGTMMAQIRIGVAGAGAIAERPEVGGIIIVLLALPETMVILGFALGAFIVLTLGGG